MCVCSYLEHFSLLFGYCVSSYQRIAFEDIDDNGNGITIMDAITRKSKAETLNTVTVYVLLLKTDLVSFFLTVSSDTFEGRWFK